MIIFEHILYKYISLCTLECLLAILKPKIVLFNVNFYTGSFVCCLLTGQLSNQTYASLWNLVKIMLYVQAAPNFVKQEIKYNKTHTANP